MHRPFAATLLAFVLALAGCVTVHEHDHPYESRGGPPPWAPAHGYRLHHHDGVELSYDAHLDVYVVVGYPHVYFHDDHYYRRVSSHWESCRSWKKARWQTVEVEVVPVKLAKHYKEKGPKHGKGKGQGPAKHDD